MIAIDFKAVTAAVYINNINQSDNGEGMHLNRCSQPYGFADHSSAASHLCF